MLISFFEEFPTKNNLKKLSLITFPTKLYIAAESLEEFNQIKSTIKSKHVKEIIYWPILKKSEGYWISPFSQRQALKRILKIPTSTPVMLDAELPTRHNPLLYLTQLFNFHSNKKLIKTFLQSRTNTYVAEYYPEGKWKEYLFTFLGLHYDPKKYNTQLIRMLYSSLHHFSEHFIQKELECGTHEHKHRFLIAFGTLAPGINKTEPKITAEQLEMCLSAAQHAKLNEVIIFRLGGLDKKYLRIFKQFTK